MLRRFVINLLLICAWPLVSAAEIRVAITFDDLPAAGAEQPQVSRMEIAQQILGVLKKHRMPPIYGFVNGILAQNMAERLQILDLWKKSGNLVGNHTYSHLDLEKVTPAEFIADLEKNESILIDYADSIAEIKWLRFPFLHEGDSKDKRYTLRSYLARRAYQVAQVSIDFQDWNWNEPYLRCVRKQTLSELESSYLESARMQLQFSDKLAKTLYGAKRRISQILLLHFSPVTAHMLDRLLQEFEQAGVIWISSLEGLNDPVFKEDTSYVKSGGKLFFLQAIDSHGLNPRDWKTPAPPLEKLQTLCI